MIRKLRLKFVAICMSLVTAILAAVFLSAYFSTARNISNLNREMLYRAVAEDSAPGGFRGPDIAISIGGDPVLPYFTVNLWHARDGSYTAQITGGTYANLEDTDELTSILQDCLAQERNEGTIDAYHLRYLRQDNGLYEKLAFVDVSMEQALLRHMIGSYLIIALLSMTLLLGVSVLLSRWATRPVETAWRQQKQFLSDASHELKTPLTVILSNAELLEQASLDGKPARWTDNILSEAGRMRSLVEEMLTLARADNMTRTPVLSEVAFSETAESCSLAFEPVAFEAGKCLDYTLAENVNVLGDRDKLRQLISILLDNAIKYSSDGGTITMTLDKTDKHARLTVSNPGQPIPPEQLRRLFERFYRADASRGEKSGFGLGLSIAQTIASEHKATLRAESDTSSTRFIFTIPLKK